MVFRQLGSRLLLVALIMVVGAAGWLLTPAETEAQVSARGTGTVVAEGDGHVGIRMDGTLTLTGSGRLAVIDFSGDGSIDISGYGRRSQRQTNWGLATVYEGFNGEALLTGSGFGVALEGFDVDLTATGSGAVRLNGSGTYSITTADGTETGAWTDAGVTLNTGE